MQRRILFVDDESKILKSFNRVFMDTEYEIVVAESGIEALQILESQKIDLIVSDMRMPNMTGYELLSEVKKRFPHIVRIILSGFAEEQIIFDSLQKNIAKIYILKPWENSTLISIIDNVFKIEDVLNNNNVLKIIKSADELPSIKMSYQKIIDAIENNEEICKIVEAIETDNSIATKLLHVINSAHYGVKTGSIKRVVSYIGLENVKNIVITSALVESLGFGSKEEKILEMFWKQAIISNKIVSYIYSEFLKKKIPETEMNAGLLNNIGMVFMICNFHRKYEEILEEVRIKGTNLIEFENKCFGTDHQEIGGYLLRWWDIPLPIVEAALYHHNPFNEHIINKQIVYVIHIAVNYAWSLLGENNFITLNQKVFKELGIKQEAFEDGIKENLELNGLLEY